MAFDNTGSLRKLTIEGIPFRVPADINVSEIIANIENTMIATSGDSMRKMIKRVPARESFQIAANGVEKEMLKGFAESEVDLKVTYTDAAGNVYRCEGALDIENYETVEGRLSCMILPRNDWDSFTI